MTMSKRLLVGLAAWAVVLAAAVVCVCTKEPEYCGGKTLQETQFCFNKDSVLEKCGGTEAYKPDAEFCHSDGRVYTKCDGKTYNPTIDFCHADKDLYPLCGGKDKYDPMNDFCYSNGVAYRKCNGKEYDADVQKCNNGKLQEGCGGKYYYIDYQFCYKDNLYDKCGDSIYSPATHFCAKDDIVYARCGDATYDPLKWMCIGVTRVQYVTVAFDVGEGVGVNAPASKKIEYDKTFILPRADEVAPREGYILGYWLRSNGSVPIKPGTETLASLYLKDIGSTVVFSAQWCAEVAVVFDENGGDNTVPQIMTGTGLYITLPGSPGRAGYYFAGWNTRADGTGDTYAAKSSYTVNGNATLFAQWATEVQYVLTVVNSYGEYGYVRRNPDGSYYSTGTEVTLTATPYNNGYKFARWEVEGGTRITDNPLTIKMDSDKRINVVFER